MAGDLNGFPSADRQSLQPLPSLLQRDIYSMNVVSSVLSHSNRTSEPSSVISWTYVQDKPCDENIVDRTVVKTYSLLGDKLVKTRKLRKKKEEKSREKLEWREDEMRALFKVVDITLNRKLSDRGKETPKKKRLSSRRPESLQHKLDNIELSYGVVKSLIPNRTFTEVLTKINTVNFALKYKVHYESRSQRFIPTCVSNNQSQNAIIAEKAKKALQRAKGSPNLNKIRETKKSSKTNKHRMIKDLQRSKKRKETQTASVSSPVMFQPTQSLQTTKDELSPSKVERLEKCKFLDECLNGLTQTFVPVPAINYAESTPKCASHQVLSQDVRRSRILILDACLQAQTME